MNKKKFVFVISIFSKSVNSLLSYATHNRVWLKSVGKMVLSLMNNDLVLEDMIIFKKYVKNGNVLDFGTGSGFIALLLAADGFKVSAVDVDNYKEYGKNTYNRLMTEDQIKLWKKLTQHFTNLSYTHYQDNIPYKDNSFNGVCAYAVLEHIPDKNIRHVLAEIGRVLKPNGILFISRLPRKLSWSEYFAKRLGLGSHEKLYADNEMSRMLVKSKFKIIEVSFEEVLPAYPESITNRLYPLLQNINKLLMFTPLKYFSHHLRIVSRVVK